MQRSLQDLNAWFNAGANDVGKRLKFRTASFCNERSGHFDPFDQGVSFFLVRFQSLVAQSGAGRLTSLLAVRQPNMTWIQPRKSDTPVPVALPASPEPSNRSCLQLGMST